MIANNSKQLVNLAFDYASAKSEQQVARSRDEAAKLAPEKNTFTVWLELVDHIKAWNNSHKHDYPLGRGSALLFFLTRLNNSQRR